MKKFIYWLVFSFTLVSFTILMSYLFVFPIFQKEKEILIPDITNLAYEEAAILLENLNLKYEINYIDSSIEQNNKVVKTIPNVQKFVKKNSKVIVFLGKSVQAEMMKNYLFNTFDQVRDELKELESNMNLQLLIVYEKNDVYPNNTILDQYPKENQLLQRNSVVVLYVSSYEGKIYIPDFKNWTLEMLLSYQKENQINFEFAYEFSATVEKDKVIRQSILPNTVWYKNKDEKIVLYLSKGKNLEEMPHLEGLDIASAIFLLEYLNINYEIVYVSSNIEKNQVIEQIYEVSLGFEQTVILKVSK